MIPNLSAYATLVFDCDGVVLDSNRVKTEAFRTVALPWGEKAAEALVAHHVDNGGISRHQKFCYFIESILPEYSPQSCASYTSPSLEELLRAYASSVRNGLLNCAVAEGLTSLRSLMPQASWCIVSGGDQTELREIFEARGLDSLFDGGIFGSPDNKDIILARELSTGRIRTPSIFLGDSRYDYQAASRAGIDFLFVSGWSEFNGWEDFIKRERLQSISSLSRLLPTTTQGS